MDGGMRMAHTQHTLEHTTQEMVHGLVRERVLCCGGGVVGGRLGLVSRWFGQLYAALLRLRAARVKSARCGGVVVAAAEFGVGWRGGRL